MVPYLLFTLHLFLQSGPGARHFLLQLLSDFLQVFLSLGGQGFYCFPEKEQKNLPVSPEHDIHGNFLSTFLMNILLYIKLVLKSSMFFTILLTWRVFAFNIFISIRCIYTVIIHVWRYLRCLF